MWCIGASRLVLAALIAAVAGSTYLAYILIFVMHNFCLVCFGIHGVNVAALYCAAMMCSGSRAAGRRPHAD